MKTLSAILLLAFSLNTFAVSSYLTCLDKNDTFNENNLLMFKINSRGEYKLMDLRIDGAVYFENLNGSIKCEAGNANGPTGLSNNSSRFNCELDDYIAQITWNESGYSRVDIFQDNESVDSFAKFECN